jgi:hypothetical protein
MNALTVSYERVQLENGKYTVILGNNGTMTCHRYGEPWRELTGDKLVYALAVEVQRLRGILEEAAERLQLL